MQVRRDKLTKLQQDGRDPFKTENYERTAFSKAIREDFESYEGKFVKIAGRIMAKRIMGKACFLDIQDRDGRIQTYIKSDAIGLEEYDVLQIYDIGDNVGVAGKVFKTKKEEISVKAEEVLLLSTSLQVLRQGRL